MTEARRQLEAARDRAIEQARRAYFDADEMYRHETGRLQDADPPSWPMIAAHTTPMRDAMQVAEHAGLLRRHKLRRQAEQITAEHYDSLRKTMSWLQLPDQPPRDTDELQRLETNLRAQSIRHDLQPYETERTHAKERLDQARTQPITNTDVRDLAAQIRHEHAKQQPATTAETRETKPREPRPRRETTPNRMHGMRL